MKIFEITSIPIDEVVRELGSLLQTEVINNCGEYYMEIPSHLGTGFIRGVSFDHGLGFIQYGCNFKEDMEIRFIRNGTHPLKFLYVLEGELTHLFNGDKKANKLEKFQQSIVASKSKIGHVLRFYKNLEILLNSLEINRKKFYPKLECSIDEMEKGLRELFKDVDARNTYYHEGYYNLELSDLFQQVQELKCEPGIRKIFLEGMVFQMLYEELHQYYTEKNSRDKVLLRKNEIAAIEEAVLIIQNEISNLPNIREIAYRVGLNSNKLQDGFKRMYGTTVNKYIREKRIEKAGEYLRNTNLNISEISDKLGLSSRSYFSKIFRNKYGLTPVEFRKKNKIK